MEQIRLDLIPNGIMPNVHASQFDKSRTVQFNLCEGDTPFTLLATDNVKVTCNGVEDSTLATAGTSHDWTIPDSVVADSGIFIGELSVERGSKTIGSKNFVLNVEEDAYNGKNIEERTASGSIANFETNLQDNLTACKCTINPLQDLHGYTKPWSGGAGKNKLDYLNNLRASSSGLTIEGTSSGAIHYSGTASQGYCQLTYTFNLSIASGTTIAVSRSSAVAYQHYFSLTYTDDSVEYLRILANQTSATITLSKALKSIDIVCLGLTVGNSYNDTIKFQLEIGSSATAWEPYENICPISGFSGANINVADENMVVQKTTAISFGQTVYGGVLDVTNGKLKITHGYKALDGTENWSQAGSGANLIFSVPISDMESGTNLDGISSYFPLSESYFNYGCRFGYVNNLLYIYQALTITGVTDLASFKTYLSNNNLQICYPLATPTEITLTPKQIEALLGINNVYHDCNGETEVKYLVEV